MDKLYNPKVSIIIPVYNGENYLKDAIDSALSQTYTNIEIIVVDDGSIDETEKVARSYGNKIKYYKKENGGTSSALNYGIKKMDGEYFSWLSHDDLYEKNKIEVQVKKLSEQNDKKVIVSCNVKVVDANLNEISIMKKDEKLLESSALLFLALDTDTGLNGCSLLIPKTCLDNVGNFDENCLCTQDYDMWFRLTKFYKFINCSEVLVLSRRHDKQDSVTKTDICTEEADELHARMLSTFEDISNLKKYIDEEYLISKYILYKISGYRKTAISILKIIINYYMLNKEINKLYAFAIKHLGLSVDVSLKDFTNSIMKKNDKKNIIYFNNVWISGGIERVLSNMFIEISDKYNINLISTKIDEVNGPYIPSNVKKIIIDKVDIYSIAGISYCLNADIFVGNPNIDSEFIGVYEILKIVKIKSVGIMHYNYFLPYRIDFLKMLALNRIDRYRYIDIVVCLTDYFNQIYSVFNENGITIPNTLNIEMNEVEREKRENYFRLLAVARFDDDVKRIDRILKVFSLVYKKNKNTTLDILGIKGEEVFCNRTGMTIKEFLEKNNIPENKVVFHGEKSDIQKFYEECDIYISTSESEGFSMTLLEAISFQMPIVMMKINGLEALIEDNENGYVVDQDDLKEMASKILSLMDDKSEYIKMSKKSYEKSKKINKDTIIKKWTDLFDELIKDSFDINRYKEGNEISENYYKQAIKEYEEVFKKVLSNNSNINNEKIMANTIKLLSDDNILLNNQLAEANIEINNLRGLEIDLKNKLMLCDKNYGRVNKVYRYYLEHGKKAFIKRIFNKIFEKFKRK